MAWKAPRGSSYSTTSSSHCVKIRLVRDIDRFHAIEARDAQQLIDQPVHAGGVVPQLLDLRPILERIESGCEDGKRRAQLVCRVGRKLPLYGKTLFQSIGAPRSLRRPGAAALKANYWSAASTAVAFGPMAAAISDAARTGFRPRRMLKTATASIAAANKNIDQATSTMNLFMIP